MNNATCQELLRLGYFLLVLRCVFKMCYQIYCKKMSQASFKSPTPCPKINGCQYLCIIRVYEQLKI